VLEYSSSTSWTFGDIDFTSQVGVPAWVVGLPAYNIGTGGGTNPKTYSYVVTATDANGVEGLPSTFINFASPNEMTSTYGIRTQWTAVTGASFYTVYKRSSTALGVYGFVGETKSTFFDDYNFAPNMAYQPPEENTPFTTANNKPTAIGFYQQRTIFGGSIINRDNIWASKTGDYFSLRYSKPSADDDALIFRITSNEGIDVRHIVAINDLIVLTGNSEFLITEGQDFVLTPTTVGAKPQSYFGSSHARPVVIEDDVIYVQKRGDEVRNLGFTIENSKYIGSSLSLKAEHLFSDGSQDPITVVEMAYADHPYKTLWCVMDNGDLYGLTYQPRLGTWGWHKHFTPNNGEFKGVATIEEDGKDVVYFVVKRGSERFIEKLATRYDERIEDSFFVDSGITYDGSPTTTITGLDHLEGTQVYALADGAPVGPYTVSSGQITLDDSASVVHAGYKYESRMGTLGIDSAERTFQGRVKNVSEVAIRFINSKGGQVSGNVETVKTPIDYNPFDTTETREERVKIHPEWDDDGTVSIRQTDPMPMTIATITPRFDIGG